MRAATNAIDAIEIFEARVPSPKVTGALRSSAVDHYGTLGHVAAAPPIRRIERPIFIVAAPRSGSTLLFETLMQARDLVTVGGEAHWLVEGLPHLRPGDAGIDSNRLAAAQADEVAREHVERALRARLRDRDGLPPAGSAALRVLEKTSKN